MSIPSSALSARVLSLTGALDRLLLTATALFGPGITLGILSLGSWMAARIAAAPVGGQANGGGGWSPWTVGFAGLGLLVLARYLSLLA